MRRIPDVITSLFILLFVYATIMQLADFENYAGKMRNQPSPKWLNEIAIYLILAGQILVVILFFVRRALGMLLSTFLLVTFTAHIALIVFNAYEYVPCSCAGVFNVFSWEIQLVIHIILLSIAIIGLASVKQTSNLIAKGPA